MSESGEMFDAVVVGGGPAGTSAAIRLASGGARVLLAEQKRFPREKLCGEFISPECLAHFESLGVAGEMRSAGGAEIGETIFYAQSGRSTSVPSEWFHGGARAALGLSRAEMDRLLLERAREAGVEVLEETSMTGVLTEDGRVRGVRLKTEGRGAAGRGKGDARKAEGRDEREVIARVTLDATGRHRAVSRRAARTLEGEDAVRERAPLVAFKAHLEGARGARGVCEIYFYRGGYGGLSPVEGGASNLCFIARARDARAYGGDAEKLVREVLMRNRRAATTLEGARAHTRWLGVALEGFGRFKTSPARGLLAVGDAAAFIDPFTGSGMLMALESGELAARAVSRWLQSVRRGGDDFDALAREYESSYDERFAARLRVCGLLRRAAFAPTPLAELAVVALGASAGLRRALARSTRRSEPV